MMSDTEFTTKYEPVLKSIEGAITDLYRANPDLTDANVDKVVESLLREYMARERSRTIPEKHLNELLDGLYTQLRGTCELCLGEEKGEAPMSLTIDEVIACLKRIRSSIKLWTKDYGRQGYLKYIEEWLPESESAEEKEDDGAGDGAEDGDSKEDDGTDD